MTRAGEVMSPMMRRVRAYFAPVNRSTETPVLFDIARDGLFALHAPPTPWIDLGWVDNFERHCETKIEPVRAGAPSALKMQARSTVEAGVRLRFQSWSKLPLALSAGFQQMNVLRGPATAIGAGATALSLPVGASAAAAFAPGDVVAVDVDYAGTTGWLGAGVSGAYLRSALSDVDYIRRVTLNVGRVASVANGALLLANALPAGAPSADMKVSAVAAFCDREGSSFFQEWSGLFVAEGQQGERVIWHYPRLQSATGATESVSDAPGGLKALTLAGTFRALPVVDPLDGENVVCFRSYLAV